MEDFSLFPSNKHLDLSPVFIDRGKTALSSSKLVKDDRNALTFTGLGKRAIGASVASSLSASATGLEKRAIGASVASSLSASVTGLGSLGKPISIAGTGGIEKSTLASLAALELTENWRGSLSEVLSSAFDALREAHDRPAPRVVFPSEMSSADLCHSAYEIGLNTSLMVLDALDEIDSLPLEESALDTWFKSFSRKATSLIRTACKSARATQIHDDCYYDRPFGLFKSVPVPDPFQLLLTTIKTAWQKMRSDWRNYRRERIKNDASRLFSCSVAMLSRFTLRSKRPLLFSNAVKYAISVASQVFYPARYLSQLEQVCQVTL